MGRGRADFKSFLFHASTSSLKNFFPVEKYFWFNFDQACFMLGLSLRILFRQSCDDYAWIKLVLTLVLQSGQV